MRIGASGAAPHPTNLKNKQIMTSIPDIGDEGHRHILQPKFGGRDPDSCVSCETIEIAPVE